MLKVFQVCFATGVIFSLLSFIIGRVSDISHMGVDTGMHADIDTGLSADAHFDTAIHTDLNGHAEIPGFPVSPLKPIVITTFVTVFGGIGMICTTNGLSQLFSLIAALLSGTGAAFLIYRFIVVPIYRAQNTSAISQRELCGALAKVTLPIRGSQFGKISYSIRGNTYSAPARSVDGEDIERGIPVVIISIEKNTFYVKKIKGGF